MQINPSEVARRAALNGTSFEEEAESAEARAEQRRDALEDDALTEEDLK